MPTQDELLNKFAICDFVLGVNPPLQAWGGHSEAESTDVLNTFSLDLAANRDIHMYPLVPPRNLKLFYPRPVSLSARAEFMNIFCPRMISNSRRVYSNL